MAFPAVPFAAAAPFHHPAMRHDEQGARMAVSRFSFPAALEPTVFGRPKLTKVR